MLRVRRILTMTASIVMLQKILPRWRVRALDQSTQSSTAQWLLRQSNAPKQFRKAHYLEWQNHALRQKRIQAQQSHPGKKARLDGDTLPSRANRDLWLQKLQTWKLHSSPQRLRLRCRMKRVDRLNQALSKQVNRQPLKAPLGQSSQGRKRRSLLRKLLLWRLCPSQLKPCEVHS